MFFLLECTLKKLYLYYLKKNLISNFTRFLPLEMLLQTTFTLSAISLSTESKKTIK